MSAVVAAAPAAPGRWGAPVEPTAMLRYLEQLGGWRDGRRAELDDLDRAALDAPDPAALTADITLSMALWQAVAGRYDELERVWDSGRVGPVELQRLSALVWGRLDAAEAGGTTLAVSLPEACRLSDALAGQLRQRLSLDPVGLDLAAHLRSLRASLERVRDLVDAEPKGQAKDAARERLARLDQRMSEVSARAQRGADVGGLVGPLESDVALMERDLIVADATRRDDERDRARALALREDLAQRAVVVGQLADRCVGRVRPAPMLAVPRVEALGPVPEEPGAVDAYLQRLATVDRALTQAEAAYRAPLAELEDLDALLHLYQAKASGTGRGADPEVAELYRLAAAILTEVPADLPRARAVVAAFQTLLAAWVPTAPSGRTR
jgi:hypothetical protein